MRLPRRLLACFVFLFVGGLARATTLVPMSDEDLVRTSTLIALGTVRRVESRLLADGRVVTEVTLAVERALKGHPRSRKIIVTQAGGRVAGRWVAVFGSAEFAVGERALVFLRRGGDGRLRPNALALGKYRVEPGPAGRALARRAVPTPDVRDLDAFMAGVRALAQREPEQRVPSGRVRTEPDRPVVAGFTFLGDPPGRWFDTNVSLKVANSDFGFGSTISSNMIAAAMAAWTEVASASIVLGNGGATGTAPSIAGGACNGVSTVQFNDPFDEVEDLSPNCTGVLAVGGFCVGSGTMTVGGTSFVRIAEGDVTLNDGLSLCFNATKVAEVVTHEIGHAIGLGHSSENPNEPNPTLKSATMYFLAHFDGRGASIRADDIAGVSAIYPGAGAGSPDADGDGVPDTADACPGTAAGQPVDASGCACSDAGHVSCADATSCTADACNAASGQCVHTDVDCSDSDPCTADSCVNAVGCMHAPIPDSDNDGLCDAIDDSDADGTVDLYDRCPDTPAGLAADATGCACAQPDHVSCDDLSACTTDSCDVATGACVNAPIACEDADPCTIDTCEAEAGCVYAFAGDGDGDGLCDPIDVCPRLPSDDQSDHDADGVGDACSCTSPRPGRCVPAGGKPPVRCLVEWLPEPPPPPRGGMPSARLTCRDGDPACDTDSVPGQCTIATQLCVNNHDPRFGKCVAIGTTLLDVVSPRPNHPRDAADGANAATLAAAFGGAVDGLDQCSAPLPLIVPTRGRRPGVRKLRMRGQGPSGKALATLRLACTP